MEAKYQIGQHVVIVALITRYVNKTGVIKNVLSDSTPIPRYLIKLDDLQEEILFDEWEIKPSGKVSTTQGQ